MDKIQIMVIDAFLAAEFYQAADYEKAVFKTLEIFKDFNIFISTALRENDGCYYGLMKYANKFSKTGEYFESMLGSILANVFQYEALFNAMITSVDLSQWSEFCYNFGILLRYFLIVPPPDLMDKPGNVQSKVYVFEFVQIPDDYDPFGKYVLSLVEPMAKNSVIFDTI
jgi:hypothetical protein